MTRRFECIACGRTETLSIWPDCCSSCGSSVSLCDDEDAAVQADDEPVAAAAEEAAA